MLQETSRLLAVFYTWHLREMRAIEREHQGLEVATAFTLARPVRLLSCSCRWQVLLHELRQARTGPSSHRALDQLTAALHHNIARLHSKLVTHWQLPEQGKATALTAHHAVGRRSIFVGLGGRPASLRDRGLSPVGAHSLCVADPPGGCRAS